MGFNADPPLTPGERRGLMLMCVAALLAVIFFGWYAEHEIAASTRAYNSRHLGTRR